MQSNKRGMLLLLIGVQSCCVAAGVGFHYFYCSSAVSRAEDKEARSQLARPLQQLVAELGPRSLDAVLKDDAAQRVLFGRCQFSVLRDPQAFLLDRDGMIAVSNGTTPLERGSRVRLARASTPWGQFDAPIHGVLNLGQGRAAIAIAQPLQGRDGYLLVAGMAADLGVTSTFVRDTLRGASGIALLWTCGLLSATLFLVVSYFQNEHVRSRVQPELEALKQAQTLVRTQESIIFGLAKLADSRDSETGHHLERISQYATALASAVRQRPEFHEAITTDFVQLIGLSSVLHDIGKVGVADAILRKPDQLTAAERSQMQMHTEIGEECLKEIERRLGTSNFLQMAREIAAAHHERWDGRGYPRGLRGEQIPLCARIVALADVYDALASKRVYKDALPHDQCVAQIADAAGRHFDPRVVETFLQIQARFEEIASQFAPLPEPSDPIEQTFNSASTAITALNQAERLLIQASQNT